MKLGELDRSQYMLLVIFVSFFSAIVSAIVVISLMEQAPKDVTRVIQRVVVKTVEKVAPEQVQTKVITQEKKVLVTETDLVKKAIEKVKPSVVGIYTGDKLLTNAVIIGLDGTLLAPNTGVTENLKVKYAGKFYALEFVKSGGAFSFFKIKDSETKFPSLSILSSMPSIGSSVSSYCRFENEMAVNGIISSVEGNYIISSAKSKQKGCILIDLSGNLIAIAFTNQDAISGKYYLASQTLSILDKEEKNKEEQGNQDTNATTTPNNSDSENSQNQNNTNQTGAGN